MGKVDCNHQSTKLHFSHPHPLTLIDLNQPHHHQHHQQPLSLLCAGCKLSPHGSIYTCTTCNNNYFLHNKCFEMPKKITHPCHKDHAFTLLTEPAYPNGLFQCDACHGTSGGFSYHCKPCGVDLHILCAVMPLSITHVSHKHDLKLEFSSPYFSKDFCCDICKSLGSNHWLYRCAPCGFDAHLKCARSKPPPTTVNNSNYGLNNHTGVGPDKSVPSTNPRFIPQMPQPFHGAPVMSNQYMQYNQIAPNPVINSNNIHPAIGVPAGVRSNHVLPPPHHNQYGTAINRQQSQSEMMIVQAMQQMMQNSNATGFVGGNNAQMQQLMRTISGLNGNGGGGLLQGLMNGGIGSGGGFLQGLMNGGIGSGGGGGGDVLQSLLGGGNGGLDFLVNGGGLDMLGGVLENFM